MNKYKMSVVLSKKKKPLILCTKKSIELLFDYEVLFMRKISGMLPEFEPSSIGFPAAKLWSSLNSSSFSKI